MTQTKQDTDFTGLLTIFCLLKIQNVAATISPCNLATADIWIVIRKKSLICLALSAGSKNNQQAQETQRVRSLGGGGQKVDSNLKDPNPKQYQIFKIRVKTSKPYIRDYFC